MGYRPDPGGVFASAAHRHVLCNLPLPHEDFSYSVHALHPRLEVFPHVSHVQGILDDLTSAGYAEHIDGLYSMTHVGYAALTGPIANEPPPGSPVEGPATIVPGLPQVYDDGSVQARTLPGPAPRPRRDAA